jgi:hypothetical protein
MENYLHRGIQYLWTVLTSFFTLYQLWLTPLPPLPLRSFLLSLMLLIQRTLTMTAMIGKQYEPLSSPMNRLTYLS